MRRLISIIGVVTAGALMWKRRGAAKKPLEAARSAVPSSVADRVQGVTEKATQAAHSTLDKAQGAIEKVRPGHDQTTKGQESDKSSSHESPGSSSEPQSGAPQQKGQPSVHETVKEELADVQEKVDSLRSQSEAPTDKAEDSAMVSGVSVADTVTGEEAARQEAVAETDAAAHTATTGKEEIPHIDRAAEVAKRTSGEFVGNKHTRIFHPASTGHMPSEKNRVYFENEEEALAAGFQPASNEDFEPPHQNA